MVATVEKVDRFGWVAIIIAVGNNNTTKEKKMK